MSDTPQESPASDDNPFDTAAEPKKRRFHWKTGTIFALVSLAVVLVLYNVTEDRNTQVIRLYLSIGGGGIAMMVWWMFFSGLRWRTRFIGLALVVAALTTAKATLRLDGWTGDFFPILSFRWSPTPEERAANFFDFDMQKVEDDKAKPKAKAKSDDEEDNGFFQAENMEPAEPIEIAGDDWPAFRGADRSGIVTNQHIRTDWDSNPPKEIWKHPAGPAWSGIAVVGDYVFTQEQRGANEATVCYDFKTGKQVWITEEAETRHATSMGGIGPRATPVVYDSRLYTLGGLGQLNCLEPKTGRKLWSRNVLTDADSRNAAWGMAGSPLVFDDKVIVSPGDSKGPAVIAYNRKTGERLWETGVGPAGYAAPRLDTIDGQRQIVIFGNDKVGGYSIEEKAMLWSFPWPNDIGHNCTQPFVLKNGNVLISTGYSKGAALLSVKKGDYAWNVEPVDWKFNKRFKLKFNDGVHKEGYIYGSNEGILCSFDTITGKVAWKKERVGYGQLLMVGDHIIALSEKGDLFLVLAHPRKYKRLGKHHVLEGKCWNHLALARGHVFVRSDAEIACYDISAEPNSTASVSE